MALESENTNVMSTAQHRSRKLRYALLAAGIAVVAYVIGGYFLERYAAGYIRNLSNARITYDALTFRYNGTVELRNLSVEPVEAYFEGPLIEAGNLRVEFNWWSFLYFRPRIRSLILDDFEITAQCNLDNGRWNFGSIELKTRQKKARPLFGFSLEDGILRYSKIAEGQTRTIAEIPIDAQFDPDPTRPRGWVFDIHTAPTETTVRSILTGYIEPGMINVQGSVSSEDLPAVERTWQIRYLTANLNWRRNGEYVLRADIRDLEGSTKQSPDYFEINKMLFFEQVKPLASLQKFFARYNPVGRIDINLESLGNFNDLQASDFRATIHCRDTSINFYQFPYTIEKITGRIDVTAEKVTLKNLYGYHNDVGISINGFSSGFGEDWKCRIHISSDNMALDTDLYNAFASPQQAFWDYFNPSGRAVIDYYYIRRSPEEETAALAMELLQTSAQVRDFNYPLENLTGMVYIQDDRMSFVSVNAHRDDASILLNGRIDALRSSRPTYQLRIQAEGLPIDEALLHSLNPQQQQALEQFGARGMIDADIHVTTDRQTDRPYKIDADITLSQGTLEPNALAVKLENVSGQFALSGDQFEIRALQGQIGEQPIQLAGGMSLAEPYDQYLTVDFPDTTLDDLRHFDITADMVESFERLTIAGPLNIRIRLARPNAQSSLAPDRITLRCSNNTITIPGLSHPLRNVDGRIDIELPFALRIEELTAHSAAGPNDTNGTLVVNGWILPFGDDVNQLECQFVLDFNDFDIHGGHDLSDIHGQITAEGRYRKKRGFQFGRGQFDLAHVRLQQKRLEQVSGHFAFDPTQQQWESKHFTGLFYKGLMVGNARLGRGPSGWTYQLWSGFEDVSLQAFLANADENAQRSTDHTQGILRGTLSIGGSLFDKQKRLGRCRFDITDMQVGKLSVPAKLLVALQLSQPTEYAFDQMVVDGYLEGSRMRLALIDLSGEAVAFEGSGVMDLAQDQVAIQLTARGPRVPQKKPSFLQSLTEGIGQAVVRLDVSGDINDPKIETRALPVIQDSFLIFGSPKDKP